MFQIRFSQVAILAISDSFRLKSLWTFSCGNGGVGAVLNAETHGDV
jgi:hypothetical protein